MPEEIEIRSIKALNEIRERLGLFLGQVRTHAINVQVDVRSKVRFVEELGRERLDELSAAQRAVSELDDDDDGYYELDRLETAETALRQVRAVARECDKARKRFEVAIGCLTDRSASVTYEALSVLEGKIRAVSAYVSIQPHGDADAPTNEKSDSVSPIRSSVQQSEITLQDGSGRLPLGFVWIELSDINESDFLTDPLVFKKVKHEDMRRGLELLRDKILPAVDANPLMKREDIVKLDQRYGTSFDVNGFVHKDSLTTVWDAFFDPRHEAEIVVIANTVNGRWEVINGRHRLGVARELGMEALPCKILRRL
jgi:hypothetical protein